MRPSLLCIFSFFFLCLLPLSRAENADGGDVFVDAYWNAQQAEKAEHAGNLRQALTKFREAARLLDVVASKYPSWSPQIVEYRKKLTAESIVRVQEKLGHAGGGELSPVEPSLPRSGGDNQFNETPQDIPRIPDEPLPGDARPKKGRSKAPAAGNDGDGSDLLENVKKLQKDLETARGEVHRLQDENAQILNKLDEAAKARFAFEKQQEILQKRAQLAEANLLQETNSNHASAEKVAVLTKELNDSKKALNTMKIEAEADIEYRHQLEERYKSQFNRISELTKQRDDAKSLSESAPGKIDAAEKKLAAAIKEKQDLAVKLQTTQSQLQEMTVQRDDALAQVTKLKEAQKQVDKLVADNASLMAKLSDAQKSIAEFKAEGVEKDKQIDALKKEVGSVRAQLDSAKKESADYQKKMGDLQAKLDDTAKQLAVAKTENTESAAEKKKMQEENQVLRSIVLRQQKKEAERMAMKKVVLGELSKLEINSKSLLKQIDFLSEPIVRLSPKERALFKKAELQVSDTEISMFISQTEESAKAAAATPAASAAPTESKSPETKPADAATAPKTSEPTVAQATPAPASTPQAIPAAKPQEVVAQATPAPVAQPTPATPAPVAVKATPKPKKGEKIAKAATPAPTPAPVAATPEPTQLAKSEESKPALALAPELPTNAAPAKPLSEISAPMTTPAPESKPSATTETASAQQPEMPQSQQGNVPNVPAELVPLAKEGKEMFDRGKYVEAEKVYQKILQKAPRNLYALSNLGVVLFRSGKFKMAEEAFNKAIAVAPEDGFSHCTLGIVCYSEQKLDDAVNELTKALAINPKNATAHNYLGITASQKGWPEAAQKELEKAVSLDPSYADAYFNLAVVYATQNPPNKEQARKQYKRAIELGAEADTALEQLIK